MAEGLPAQLSQPEHAGQLLMSIRAPLHYVCMRLHSYDTIYHIEPGPGSYSTRFFKQEDDDSNEAAGPTSANDLGCSALRHESRTIKNPWYVEPAGPARDLLLAGSMRGLIQQLAAAGTGLHIQRAIVDEVVKCQHLFCVDDHNIFGGQLYFELQAIGKASTMIAYHLACLENLSASIDICSIISSPDIYDEAWSRHVRALCIDPARLCDSLLPEEHFPSNNDRIRIPEKVNRFQYLAKYILLGTNLLPKHEAVLKLWIVAAHRQVVMGKRHWFNLVNNVGDAAQGACVLRESWPTPQVHQQSTIRACETMTRLKVGHCYSKNISEVFNLVN